MPISALERSSRQTSMPSMSGSIKSRTTRSGLVDFAISALTLPGQSQSGDLSLVKAFPGGVLIGVVDGLGHGSEAAVAARKAIETLERHPQEPVEELVRLCHKALRGTRGAVMSVASINAAANTLTWVGVGNVEAVLLLTGSNVFQNRHWLLLRGGVVGYELPTLRPSMATIARDDMLIFATDGVCSSFGEKLPVPGPASRTSPQTIADFIMAECGRGTDDALVLAARYRGAPE